jgi:hypothetical protein
MLVILSRLRRGFVAGPLLLYKLSFNVILPMHYTYVRSKKIVSIVQTFRHSIMLQFRFYMQVKQVH